jgi:hypothetical protein
MRYATKSKKREYALMFFLLVFEFPSRVRLLICFFFGSLRRTYGSNLKICYPSPDEDISVFVLDAVQEFRRMNVGVRAARAHANEVEWELYRFVNGLDPIPIGARIGVKFLFVARMQ